MICDESFVTPAADGQHSFGASYAFDLSSDALSRQEQDANFSSLQTLCPALADADWQQAAQQTLPGRVSQRCVSADYLPLVGAVPDPQAWRRDYGALQHDAKQTIRQLSEHIPDLFLNTAYGSRGLSFAPLCAELLAAQLNAEAPPLPARLRHALLPGRFLIRNICRGHFA